MASNGETMVETEDLNVEDMLQVVIEGLRELNEQVEELKLQQAEIVEKLCNLSLENPGFSYDN